MRPRYYAPPKRSAPMPRGWETTRVFILIRDDFSCVQCGVGGLVYVHHIVPRSDGGTDDHDNLVTLCPACHGLEHRGRKNA